MPTSPAETAAPAAPASLPAMAAPTTPSPRAITAKKSSAPQSSDSQKVRICQRKCDSTQVPRTSSILT